VNVQGDAGANPERTHRCLIEVMRNPQCRWNPESAATVDIDNPSAVKVVTDQLAGSFISPNHIP